MRPQSERGNKFCARQKGLCVIVPVKPLLGPYADGRRVNKFNDIIWLVDDLEGVLVVGEPTTVQERGTNFNDGFPVTQHLASDSYSLATVVVGDGENLCHQSALVTDLKGTHGVEDLEAVREMDEPQKITIDRLREDSLDDRLQTQPEWLRFQSTTLK